MASSSRGGEAWRRATAETAIDCDDVRNFGCRRRGVDDRDDQTRPFAFAVAEGQWLQRRCQRRSVKDRDD